MKHAIVIAIAVLAVAAPVWAADTAGQLNAQELARIQSGAPVGPAPMAPPAVASATGCPPGMQYVPAGYIKRGKYRPAGCVLVR